MNGYPMVPDPGPEDGMPRPSLPVQQRNDLASARILEGETPFLTSRIDGLGGYRVGQIWLGANPTDRTPVGIADDRHLMTIAGNRGGKGESAVIPNLLEYPGPVLCLDPKGENAAITSARRNGGSDYCTGLGQKVCVLDPFDVSKVPKHLLASFNPLDMIEVNSLDAVDQAKTIAESIVEMGGPNDKTWDDAAKQFLAALILYVRACQPPELRNLVRVRSLLMEGDVLFARKMAAEEGLEEQKDWPDPFDLLVGGMMKMDEFGGFISRSAAAIQRLAPETRDSILFQARTNTAFIDSQRMAACLTKSAFSFDELKTDPKGMTIYLCLPVGELAKDARWFRMMVTLALVRMEKLGRRMPACGHPVLFMLDEFGALGRVDIIERMIAFIAGFKVKLWMILQSLEQLKSNYPGKWETFIDSAGVLQCFAGSGCEHTLKYLSEKLGTTEVRQHTRSYSQGGSEGTNLGKTSGQTDSWGTQSGTGTSVNRGPNGLIFAPTMLGQSHSTSQGTQSGTSQSYQVSEGVQQGKTWTYNVSETITLAPLLRPEEIALRFGAKTLNQLLFVAGNLPLVLKRIRYHQSPHFRGKFDPDPGHLESAPQTLARSEEERRRKSLERFKGF